MNVSDLQRSGYPVEMMKNRIDTLFEEDRRITVSQIVLFCNASVGKVHITIHDELKYLKTCAGEFKNY